jgi:hypothetical protein
MRADQIFAPPNVSPMGNMKVVEKGCMYFVLATWIEKYFLDYTYASHVLDYTQVLPRRTLVLHIITASSRRLPCE